ncbi:hypothetical protein [Rhodopirellula europaea]
MENKIGARKKPLAKSQAAFGVEDNGLEPMTYALPARQSMMKDNVFLGF